MRSILAGLLVLVSTMTALAQVKGEVESIGFQNLYRPNCWTPMVVRLQATSEESGTYLIQVVQEDMDRDKVLYTRPAAIEGSRPGQSAREKRFWVYFLPQPTRSGSFVGLPDVTQQATRAE